ncbi:hypothetical protein LEP1GSC062_0377 [Leptospira alexanderi serovar Manhao 3 str. L 60]|uniref:Uncharacterized protein n=1 Tax=Leptospira alexanderi serovar Manhao 3 str. L 60 TaxID=1049759 RepID=V6I2A2_9LEPT|nr:hypothetical protein LEP1GSC062_0377 [Leptospira alexanderi serovar Manhao 3 str. L 60]
MSVKNSRDRRFKSRGLGVFSFSDRIGVARKNIRFFRSIEKSRSS